MTRPAVGAGQWAVCEIRSYRKADGTAVSVFLTLHVHKVFFYSDTVGSPGVIQVEGYAKIYAP